MSGRLPRLTPDQLDPAQLQIYRGITGGERAKGPQHFPLSAPDGSLHGPFGVMLHAPGVGGVLQELGATIRFNTELSLRQREIAILQVAQAVGSEFEWWAHERVGRAAGLTSEELMQLSMGIFRGANDEEAVSAQFVATLLHSQMMSDAEYAAATGTLSARQLIELTVLVGYYRTLAQLMTVFDIGVPEDERVPAPAHRHPH